VVGIFGNEHRSADILSHLNQLIDIAL
jgi:hypothetical protein